MKDIYEEEQINKFAEDFSKKTVDKLKSDLLDDVYTDVQSYIYEHYKNFKDKIEADLITSICEEYTKDPKQYKFAKLRQKMFNENKKALTQILTDEAIEKSVEDVIKQYTHRDYHFAWRWEDGIAKIILKHIDKFAKNERIQASFKRENDRLKQTNKYLQQQLDEIRNTIND